MSAVLRQREPRYTNRALLDLCHGAPCYARVTGCTGGTDPYQPSVPAHSNALEDGKGVGKKSHDHRAMPACPSCHWQLDFGTMLTTEQKQDVFNIGIARWLTHLLTSGKITIKVTG